MFDGKKVAWKNGGKPSEQVLGMQSNGLRKWSVWEICFETGIDDQPRSFELKERILIFSHQDRVQIVKSNFESRRTGKILQIVDAQEYLFRWLVLHTKAIHIVQIN